MKNKKSSLKRLSLSGIPIIFDICGRLGLLDIFRRFIPTHGNETVPAVESLVILLCNITLGRQPLYELEDWIDRIDPKAMGYRKFRRGEFNDDRFGRALDKLYNTDRASMMTEIVILMVDAFSLDLSEIHNDSTTLKAYGRISGKTKNGLELKKGHSKPQRCIN